MKITATLAVAMLSGLVLAGSTPAAECELSCRAECKQELAICKGEVALFKQAEMMVCETDAADAMLECDLNALEDRSDCIGSCGTELRECMGLAKSAYKECKTAMKDALKICLEEVALEIADEQAFCVEDGADCVASC